MLEQAATNEEEGEKDKEKLDDKLEVSLTKKEYEDEATRLMEEMKKNVGSCTTQKFLRRNKSCAAFREDLDSYDKDKGREVTLMTKCWQSM